jgi:hypothetical protein
MYWNLKDPYNINKKLLKIKFSGACSVNLKPNASLIQHPEALRNRTDLLSEICCGSFDMRIVIIVLTNHSGRAV